MNRIKPVSRRMLSVEVVRKEWRPGNFLLVTVGGEDLKDFRPIGVDQAFRLLFRRPGQGRLWLPSRSDATWMAQYMMTGKAARPYVRFYTVRHFWPDRNELDIEFVLHEGDSPASTWARGARPGEPVGILDEGATYSPPHGVEWQLLVGDETAVPAILSILDSDEGALPSEVFLEVPSSADIQKLNTPQNVSVHWLPRDGRPGLPGRYALDTVMKAALPAGRFATFVAGENHLPTTLRRHLVHERGVDKSDITFVGYWRHGRATPG
ncbi:siderophore-interacting protein [Streptomyces ureilyticus]|nr:siderophore-interacting protein [Streptomyces ureilyticus]